MDDEALEEFRALIAAALTDLAGEDALGRDGQRVVELDQQAVGRLSRMDALQMQAMAKAQQVRRDGQAGRLRAALARIEDGSYGECLDCGEDIPERRLEIDPTIPLCVSCASGK